MSAQCTISGDPHVNTLDGARHDYQGTAGEWYYYFRDCFENYRYLVDPMDPTEERGTPFVVRGLHKSMFDNFDSICEFYFNFLFKFQTKKKQLANKIYYLNWFGL